MAELGEGNRVQDFVAGTIIAHDTFLNEIQDQLRSLLGSRWLPMHPSTAIPLEAASEWSHTDGDPGYWGTGGNSGHILWQPIIGPREGAIITDVTLVIQGDGTGGKIKLSRRPIDTSGIYSGVAVLDITDPWSLVGVITEVNYSGLSVTVAAGYEYGITMEATTSGGSYSRYYLGEIKYKFGVQ